MLYPNSNRIRNAKEKKIILLSLEYAREYRRGDMKSIKVIQQHSLQYQGYCKTNKDFSVDKSKISVVVKTKVNIRTL